MLHLLFRRLGGRAEIQKRVTALEASGQYRLVLLVEVGWWEGTTARSAEIRVLGVDCWQWVAGLDFVFLGQHYGEIWIALGRESG